MIVACASQCFPGLPLGEVISRMVDLEFSHLEIDLHEKDGHLRPSEVLADLDAAIETCRNTRRLTPIAYSVDIEAEGDDYYRQFAACCALAKATKVVTIAVPAAELGTPFNAEVERLRELVAIATTEGVVVGVKTEIGRVTEDPDTTVVLCDNVKGLGVAFDPSHFIYGENPKKGSDKLLKYIVHVYLRDTSPDKFQVRVGQGKVEYGRIITQLSQIRFDRALSIDIKAQDDCEHMPELRKMRLLLESLL